MDQHGLISALKIIASELGRTPTCQEFIEKSEYSERRMRTIFGSYSVAVAAAGLDPAVLSKKKKLTNSIFEVSIEKHLEDYKPNEHVERGPYPTIASISDIHWPFSCQRVIDKFLDHIEKFQPAYVILNGDAWDMYSHAKFPRSHNIFTPKEEEDMARAMNVDFWKEVKRRCPKAKCIQMLGNHDVRPLKRTQEQAPTLEHWIEKIFKQLFAFDGVETIFDPRQEILIEDVLIFHGYRSGEHAHRDYTLLNCMTGHTHIGAVGFRRIRGQVLWELKSGYAGDPEAKGLTYTPQKTTHWTHGFSYVWPWGPQFITA